MGKPTAMITGPVMSTTITPTNTHMTEAVTLPALYRLLAFLSPSFPVGAFTYSHGLEQVIEDGTVKTAEDLLSWLEDVLRHGAGRSDAILLKKSYEAALMGDDSTLTELQDLALALQPSKERHLETSAQGTAFLVAVRQSWRPDGRSPAADLFNQRAEDSNQSWPYPVALGLAAAAHEIPDEAALVAYLHAFAGNIVSAAIRAVPLGQSNGQSVLASLEPTVFAVAAMANSASLEDIGSSTFLADIASMAHETQYSRLFRS
ncbi:urease accessory protein UreF [uncultured Roseibium sp.]|uniref:urease accessory protein UreF n=1 Tax=uncultured Roseibium sp. TaxID=1936171 RepID=UPI00342F2134